MEMGEEKTEGTQEVQDNSIQNEKPRRSERKKKPVVSYQEDCIITESVSTQNSKAFKTKCLETIFEEPKQTKTNETQYMSLKRFKRLKVVSDGNTVVKKNNQSKSLKLKKAGIKKWKQTIKCSLDVVLSKLAEIEDPC